MKFQCTEDRVQYENEQLLKKNLKPNLSSGQIFSVLQYEEVSLAL